MAGEIVHIELKSRDFARSASFYEKLFGWSSDGTQAGGHMFFQLPGGVRGSWILAALAEAPGAVPFVAVDDLDAAFASVVAGGGKVLTRKVAPGGRGAFGLISDPDGNIMGLLTGTAPAKGNGDDSGATAKPAAKTAGKAKATAAPGRAAKSADASAPKKVPEKVPEKAPAKAPSKPKKK